MFLKLKNLLFQCLTFFSRRKYKKDLDDEINFYEALQLTDSQINYVIEDNV